MLPLAFSQQSHSQGLPTPLWYPAYHPGSEERLAGVCVIVQRGFTEGNHDWQQKICHPCQTTAAAVKHVSDVVLGKLGTNKSCTLLLAPVATTFFSRQFSQALLRGFHSNINCWLTKILRHFQSSSVDFQENCTYKYLAVKKMTVNTQEEKSALNCWCQAPDPHLLKNWFTLKTDLPPSVLYLREKISFYLFLVDKTLENMNGG